MMAQNFTALVERLQEVPGIAQVTEVPRRMDSVTLPAIFLDVAEMAFGLDVGTDQLPLVVHWEARIIMPDALDDTVVWSLVEAVMLALFAASWSETDIGKAELKQATPDDFSPDLVGYRVWLIEWTQKIRVGDNPWNAEGIVPVEVEIRYQGSEETTVYTLPTRDDESE